MDEWIDRYRQLLRQYGLNIPISISREIGKKVIVSENEILLNDERISEAERESCIAYAVRQVLLPKIEIETERLLLRPFRMSDSEDCFGFLNDREDCYNDSGFEPFEEMDEECYEGRRQSISDFINLAIDFDHDADRKRIADRLAEMGHSMQLLSIMEEALVLVKGSRPHGVMYYKILHARYFDAYCSSNEDAYLSLGISSSTYYRHIKQAIRVFAANLWCVVIPDLIISEQMHEQSLERELGVS